MIRAVLDTNVLASAVAGAGLPASTPGELLRRWERREYTLVLSDHLLAELARTLANPYFSSRLTPDQTARALRAFRTRGELTPLTVPVRGVATHPEDDLVLTAALSARVPVLVSGDTQLQRLQRYQGVRILSPRAFLARLDQTPTARSDA